VAAAVKVKKLSSLSMRPLQLTLILLVQEEQAAPQAEVEEQAAMVAPA
jgi:hypothetical protein